MKYMWFKKISLLGFNSDLEDYSIEEIDFFCEIEQAVLNGRKKPT
jgi:hypothetical protein